MAHWYREKSISIKIRNRFTREIKLKKIKWKTKYNKIVHTIKNLTTKNLPNTHPFVHIQNEIAVPFAAEKKERKKMTQKKMQP